MKESVKIAQTVASHWLMDNWEKSDWRVKKGDYTNLFSSHNVHVHVPEVCELPILSHPLFHSRERHPKMVLLLELLSFLHSSP